MCGELRIGDVGREVTLFGWVQRQRDLGQLIFIDLRDRTGIVQLAFSDATDKSVFEKAASCRSEFVLGVRGKVAERRSLRAISRFRLRSSVFSQRLRLLRSRSSTTPRRARSCV